MLFQTMDDKSECVGIYCEGALHFDPGTFPPNLSATWKYSPHLKGQTEIEYANLYIGNQKIEDVIPLFLQEDWEDVSNTLRAYKRSLRIAQVDLQDNCLYDMIPPRFLIDWCEVKNRITGYVLENFERPARYKYLLKVCQLLEEIAQHPLRIDSKKLSTFLAQDTAKLQAQKIIHSSPYIRYNQFGTKTGRLTTRSTSFPILTLRKDLRQVVLPQHDCFVELDFNGAEARTMMGLLGLPQPSRDIHQFHEEQVFQGERTREEVKNAFFAWLYGSQSSDALAHGEVWGKFYNKSDVLDKYWDGRNVYTPFRKKIENVDEHRALNYIVQSTTAELTLLQALKIDHFLRSHSLPSRVCCIIHDAVILDMRTEDLSVLPHIQHLMASTRFGKFKINTKRGVNLGALTEMKI